MTLDELRTEIYSKLESIHNHYETQSLLAQFAEATYEEVVKK
jgi:hypothetical protein